MIELLVVIALIALLTALVLPTLKTAREQVIKVNCLSRMRQLGVAFSMYASDNHGWMASSDTCGPIRPELFIDPSGNATNIKWTGWVDGGSSSQAIQNGTLWPYLKSMAVYHCPNDINPYRLRSYSMNAYIDPGSRSSSVAEAYNIYRITQVRDPSKTILFAEDPDPRSALPGETVLTAVSQWNVNGWSQPPLSVNNPAGAWNNLLAAWHEGGANFTFIDGHAEYWHFLDQRTVDYLQNDPQWPTVVYKTPHNPDLQRISAAIATWSPQRHQK